MFRFLPAEVAEMEATAQQLTNSIFPSHEAIDALTAKFNAAPDRAGKVQVQSRQVLTWFHNHRYAPRIKEKKARRLAQLAPGETLLPAPKLRRGSSSSVLPSVQASSFSGLVSFTEPLPLTIIPSDNLRLDAYT
ncbi:hypothetical protein PR202_ga16938 [Eleusine coracana subsp. coracana]|uniref:Homeobox domain-containing protein n=1 Tax=Eleusine coracana subsp. coracana TaxID=191504 RepID=A0AAV5CMP9_ELECO|nr:hypothetical protein PR202_ga16938 [Eleusine coracana subsp. coracana]